MRVTENALATTPAAAGVMLLIARILPISFSFRPNDLGIHSATILARYPTQKETFWFVFAIAVTAVLTWAAQRALHRRSLSLRVETALEILGVAILGVAIGFPLLPAVLVIAILLALASGLVLRFTSRNRGEEGTRVWAYRETGLAEYRGSFLSRACWYVGILFLASLYSADPYAGSGFWNGVTNVVYGLSDRELMVDNFAFTVERGQHLLWADALRQGELPGRDFFSIYGPLYDLSLLGVWSIFGRSIASVTFFEGLTALAGMAALLGLAFSLVRHRWTILVLPFLTPHVSLRIGLGFVGLFFLVQWWRYRDAKWCVAAGLTAGVSILFSQEYGLALLVTAAVALVLGGQWRPALFLLAGLVAAILPIAVWLAGYGALNPMLADLVAYPSYLVAGYANLPFPRLTTNFPLGIASPETLQGLIVRLAYVPPLILVGALLIALPFREFDAAKPLVSASRIREQLLGDPFRFAVIVLALYGVLCFRSALGRSDAWHFVAVLPAAALLLCIGVDRCVELWRTRNSGTDSLLRASWRTGALAFLVFQSGMPQAGSAGQFAWGDAASPATRVLEQWKRSTAEIIDLLQAEPRPAGDPEGFALVEWIRSRTGPQDHVFFGPGNPALYYLAERPNPTRFATPYLMVTDAHRAEALADLSADPPRFIVWDEGIWLFDELPIETVLGDAWLRWVDTHYAAPVSHHGFSVRRYQPIASEAEADPRVTTPD